MMYVYSGECRKGRVGKPTTLTDDNGVELFVGDIVITLYNDGRTGLGGLTVIVDEEFTSYSDGNHKVNNEPHTAYAMGIKLGGPQWLVFKVKDHRDVVAGEHWRDYGFNYRDEGRTEPEAI